MGVTTPCEFVWFRDTMPRNPQNKQGSGGAGLFPCPEALQSSRGAKHRASPNAAAFAGVAMFEVVAMLLRFMMFVPETARTWIGTCIIVETGESWRDNSERQKATLNIRSGSVSGTRFGTRRVPGKR
jgi:hypothetical protein